MKNSIKVIIVDDQSIFRKGLLMLLKDQQDIEIIGEAANGQDFIDMLQVKQPDLVLIDIKMPIMDGITASKLAMEQFPELKILVVSMYGEEEYLISMLEAGVKGFILKTVEEEEFIFAIKTIASGKNYFSQELLGTIANSFVAKTVLKRESQLILDKLSDKEIEIIKLIAKGYTIKEISILMNISTRTVDGHKTNIFTKTGTQSSVQLVTFALRHKLIDL